MPGWGWHDPGHITKAQRDEAMRLYDDAEKILEQLGSDEQAAGLRRRSRRARAGAARCVG
jgi:hypothetical protein